MNSRRFIGGISALLFFFGTAWSQAPDTLWTKTYGGILNDEGRSVQQTSDGGYIIVGGTDSFGAGNGDVYLIKTDANGDTLWTKTYGGMNDDDEGMSVDQTSDSGYIIVGGTDCYGAGNSDVYLIKTDASGDTLWTKTYGGINDDDGMSVQETSDSGYIIGGYTNSFGAGEEDIYLIKTDISGDTLWTRTYGGTLEDVGFSVQQTSDSGYIVAGLTESFGAPCGYLVKTDVSGDILWTKTYRKEGIWDGLFSVDQTSDNGYIMTGFTYSLGGSGLDVWLIKTIANGDTLWTSTYGGDSIDTGSSVKQTSDSGYVVVGYTRSFGAGSWDVWLIKTAANGDTIWTKTYGGTDTDWGSAVQQTSDSGYIVAGYTESFGAGGNDVWLLKIAPEPGIEEDKVEAVKSSNFGATIFSGPLLLPQGKECKVFDITGRTVAPDKIKPGIYFIEVDGQITRKVIKVK